MDVYLRHREQLGVRLSHFRFWLEHFWQAFGAGESLAVLSELGVEDTVCGLGRLVEGFMLPRAI